MDRRTPGCFLRGTVSVGDAPTRREGHLRKAIAAQVAPSPPVSTQLPPNNETGIVTHSRAVHDEWMRTSTIDRLGAVFEAAP
jgi:hypothetical protein